MGIAHVDKDSSVRSEELSAEQITLAAERISLSRSVPNLGLANYIEECGFNISDLTDWQIDVFMAAQGMDKYVKDLKIPMSNRPNNSNEKIVVEVEREKEIKRTTYKETEHPSEVPANRMDAAQISRVEDLPRIFPQEWVLDEVAPDLFLEKLAKRELIKQDWRTPSQVPQESTETIKVRELEERPAPPKIEKQHAYVLMDRSGSMAEPDGRGVIAKGLAIAFLKQGYSQRAILNLRTFGGSADDLLQGRSRDEFVGIVGKILNIDHNGNTDIQNALQVATTDICSGGDFVRSDILLITDGLSELVRNPLGKTKLHSFILGNPLDGLDREGRVWAKKYLNMLKRWSTNFKEVDSSDYKNIFVPSRGGIDEIGKAIPELSKLIERSRSMAELADAFQQVNKAVKLATFYDSKFAVDGGSDKLHKIIRALRELLPSSTGKTNDQILSENLRQIAEAERIQAEIKAKQQLTEVGELTKSLSSLREKFGENSGQSGRNSEQTKESVWQWLVRWFKGVIKR